MKEKKSLTLQMRDFTSVFMHFPVSSSTLDKYISSTAAECLEKISLVLRMEEKLEKDFYGKEKVINRNQLDKFRDEEIIFQFIQQEQRSDNT